MITNKAIKFLWLFIFLTILINPSFSQTNVLHYDETTGYDHNTRNNSFDLFTELGNSSGYTVVQDSDGSEFTIAKLQNYDLVIFSNTSGSGGLNDAQKSALEWYIDDHGGSLMGIHAASDTYRHSSANGGNTGEWDWFAETLGGSVQTNPNHTSLNHVATMSDLIDHPIIENMTFPWEKEEEYYYWENGYLNDDIVQIFEVEETGNNSYDEVRPMAWYRTDPSGAKIFYTALGHKNSNFTGGFPQFEQLMEDAVLWLIESSSLEVSWGDVFVEVSGSSNSVHLHWSTLSELNVDYFEIQRSKNSFSWESLERIESLGDSNEERNYDFVDKQPFASGTYYRIKEIDLDGKASYSKVTYASLSNQDQVSIFPNPCSNVLKVTTENIEQEQRIQIYDSSFRLVKERISSGQNPLEFDVTSFHEGIYLLKVSDTVSNETIQVLKFLKK